MANTKITELQNISAAGLDDVLPIVQINNAGNSTKKISINSLFNTSLQTITLLGTLPQLTLSNTNTAYGKFYNDSGGVTVIEAHGTSGNGIIDFRINDGTTNTTAAKVASNGNFGIGTTSPVANLQLGDATSAQTLLLLGPNNNTTSAQILFGDNTSGADPFEYGMGIRYNSNNNKLHIDDNYNDGGSTNRVIMTIDRDEQRVGIGTETPDTPLHIISDLKVSSIGPTSPTIRLQKTAGTDTHEQTRLSLGTDNTDVAFEIQTYTSGDVFVSNDYRIEKNSNGANKHEIRIGNNNRLEVTDTTVAVTGSITVSSNATISGNATITGDLTVNGTTTTVSQANVNTGGALIELNSGLTAANTNDSGIIIERGTTGDNAALIWDESDDRFVLGTTTATSASTGNLAVTVADLDVKDLRLNGATTLSVHSAGTQDGLKITNQFGTTRIGPHNASYSHFYTDRAKFYFEKKLIVDEGIISAYADHDLILTTGTSPTTSSTGVFIKNSNGHVGIGTNTPQYNLDLGESASTIRLVSENNGTAIRIGANGGGNDVTLLRVDGDSLASGHKGESDDSKYGFSLKYMGSGTGAGNELRFVADNLNGVNGSVDALTIGNSGKVGINVNAPAEVLSVGGNITATGNISSVGNITSTGTLALTGNLHADQYWSTGSPAGGDLLFVKRIGTGGDHNDYDPVCADTGVGSDNSGVSKSDIRLLITSNEAAPTGAEKGPGTAGIVLYNASATAGSFSPMILFAGRETDSDDYRAATAGIYSRMPFGSGGNTGGSNYADGELIFATSGTLTGSTTNSQGVTQRMVIDRAGRVGINKVAPTEVLDVTGNIKASGTVTGATPTADTHLTTLSYMFANMYNIGHGESTKRVRSAEDLPSGESALTTSLWPDANALKQNTSGSDRNWSDINKYPMFASVVTKRANSKFRLTAKTHAGVQGDDTLAVTISYNTGSYSHGTAPSGLAETIVALDEGTNYLSGHTFQGTIQDPSNDYRMTNGSFNGIWTPGTGIAAGTTVNFFLSCFGMNDDDDRIMFNAPYEDPLDVHEEGVYVSTIICEEIYTE